MVLDDTLFNRSVKKILRAVQPGACTTHATTTPDGLCPGCRGDDAQGRKRLSIPVAAASYVWTRAEMKR